MLPEEPSRRKWPSGSRFRLPSPTYGRRNLKLLTPPSGLPPEMDSGSEATRDPKLLVSLSTLSCISAARASAFRYTSEHFQYAMPCDTILYCPIVESCSYFEHSNRGRIPRIKEINGSHFG